MKGRLATLSIVALLAAGCGKSGKSVPWNTTPNAVAHTNRYFPIMVGETHGPAAGQTEANCNGCHYDKAAAAPSASFSTYTCTNCHVLLRSGIWHDDARAVFSAWHIAAGVNQFDSTVAAADVLGVEKLDAACRSCHPSGIAVNHVKVFVLPHQNAAGTIVAKCADCHLNQADRKQLGCAACHPHDLAATTTGHALVPDFVPNGSTGPKGEAASTLCARCHQDGKIPVAVSAHAAGARGFTVGTGKHSGAAGGACLTCHPQNQTTPPRTFVADFSVTTCVGCHVTVGGTTTVFHDDAVTLGTLHTAVAAFNVLWTGSQLSAACLTCHADGSGGAPANHEQLFPRAAGTKHAPIGCAQCHGTGLKTDLNAMACASCHLARDTALPTKHGTVGGVAILTVHNGSPLTMTSPDCLRCHADSQVNRVNTHTTDDSGFSRPEHNDAGCVTCHSSLRTDKPYPATNWSAANGCKTCH
jgi:hypothetical protein